MTTEMVPAGVAERFIRGKARSVCIGLLAHLEENLGGLPDENYDRIEAAVNSLVDGIESDAEACIQALRRSAGRRGGESRL